MENTAKTKKSLSNRIGKILLIIGIILMITGIGYEVANYPFGYKNTPVAPGDLPEPKMVEGGYQSFHQEDFIGAEMPDTVPSSDTGTPLSRPQIPLYRLGAIKIPRLSLSENIFEGADDEILYGIGHVSGTPLPGEAGNFVVAGHRNYIWMHPFRHIDKVEIGDIVEVSIDEEDVTMVYTYEIYKSDTVLPEDSWVMDTQEEAEQVITLVTCTPIPSYSHRLIYWGKLVETAEKP